MHSKSRTSLIAVSALLFMPGPAPAAADCAKLPHSLTDAQKRCPRDLHTADFDRAVSVCLDAAQDADAFRDRVCNSEQYYALQLDISRWLLDAAYAARQLGVLDRAARYRARARALILGVRDNPHATANVRHIAAFDFKQLDDEPLDVRF